MKFYVGNVSSPSNLKEIFIDAADSTVIRDTVNDTVSAVRNNNTSTINKRSGKAKDDVETPKLTAVPELPRLDEGLDEHGSLKLSEKIGWIRITLLSLSV